MPRSKTLWSSVTLAMLLASLACLLGLGASSAAADDSASLKKVFANPPREYSTAPLWVWNDLLSDDQIRLTLRDLAAQNVKQAFVHPRPGLMTPYLSDEWFRLWGVALDEAERLDMNLWIYDENSYPSGFAGGWVPRLMPESRGRGLRFETTKQPANLGDDVLGVYAIAGEVSTNVTDAARASQLSAADQYLIVRLGRALDSPWTGGGPYVDLLHPGVTEKFIEVTMEPYRQRFGDQFGRRIPGWFTDEPHLAPFGAPHWSDHLPQAFRERWGYDLVEHLASLHLPVGDWKRVRHNYFQLLLEQFIDRWAKPCYEYCEQHKIEFTGHYWEHGWPAASHGGDNMAMYAWHQRPAIDNLMNLYGEDVSGQFGNARTVKELSSVANQLGRKRTLCEAYGAGGWDLRFEDMKRIGDWLVVLGVNTLDEHLSYITIRGTRKRDHPQSFSYHTPWWNDYHVMADYFTRLSAATSHGQQINRILVLQPTTAAWMYQPDPSARAAMMEIGNQFQDLSNALERAQVEYDIGCEDIMARHGSVSAASATDGPALVVGQRGYHTVVLPPRTENLNGSTVKLLEQYVAAGGRVLCCGETPQRVDGGSSDRVKHVAGSPSWHVVDPAQLPQMLLEFSTDGFAIRRADGDPGILFHMRRTLADGELLLLVNTSIEQPSAGTIHSRAQGVEQWLPQTGGVQSYPFTKSSDGVQLAFDLPPCGSLLVFLSSQPQATGATVAPQWKTIAAAGPVAVRRVGPNVLPLDFVDITAGGESKAGTYCYHATQFLFQKFGWEKNPWDHAVQYRDEIITKPFPADSRFEATYRFRIAERVPADLEIVIERPDLYEIQCNGRPVQAQRDAWWLDRAFGRIRLADVAVVGENTVVLKASQMTVFHEIESAFVIGDFALAAQDSGWSITPAAPVQLGPWNEQGLPCYAEGIVYEQPFEIPQVTGRYVLRVPAWYGSVAEVLVDGKSAGHLVSRPWQIDVTDRLQAGRNLIQVRIVGTLKNTLGPHHGKPVLGKAWPWDFRQAPPSGPPSGANYHTVGYGLFEPPVLVAQ
jgi:hypothetical protein